MKENSSMIWPRASVFTNMPTAASTLGIGTRTNNTDSARKSGTTQVCIKDFTRMQAKKDKESIAGQMVTVTSVNGAKTCSTVRVFSSGTTTDSILVIGKTI